MTSVAHDSRSRTLRPGLCSVTFRGLAPERVAALAAETGAEGIEWGGDVHVPPGDVARAAEVGRITRGAGLEAPSYGSYLRPGAPDEGGDLGQVLDAASGLGASNLRVWAGRLGSAEASDADRARVAERIAAMAEAAAARGIAVSVEFHRNTLTDTAPSAASLLQAVGHPNAFLYWQPVPELGIAHWRTELQLVRPWLSHLHVFHWLEGNVRRPLAEGEATWRALLPAWRPVPRFAGQAWAFLEFVLDDREEQGVEDIAVLRRLCADLDATDPATPDDTASAR